MKDVLITREGTINWKFIGIFLLASALSSALFLIANLKELLSHQEYQLSFSKRALSISSYLFFSFVMLVLWAWLLYLKPLLRNKVVNLVLAALLISIIVFLGRNIVSHSIFKNALPTIDKSFFTEFIIRIIPSILGSFAAILFCELLTSRFANKIWLFFLAQGFGAVIVAMITIMIPGEDRYHPFTLISDLADQLPKGFLVAFFMRLNKVPYYFGPRSEFALLKRRIIDGVKNGKRKRDLWDEIIQEMPSIDQPKLAKLFTSVAEPYDFDATKTARGYLIIYSFLTIPPALQGLNLLRQHTYNENGIWLRPVDLIIIPAVLFVFIKMFLLYNYAHQRAFAYRLTIGLSIFIGLASVLYGIKGGWIYLSSGGLHLIAASAAASVCSHAYPNYRLFKLMKGDEGEFSL